MFVQVNISLQEGETTPSMTPAEMLTALGGDPAKDTISVSVSASSSPPPVETQPTQ